MSYFLSNSTPTISKLITHPFLGVTAMSKLFGDRWMQELATLWNNDPEIAQTISGQPFHAKIGYGFTEVNHPTGILVIAYGRIKQAGLYQGQTVDWDLRAEVDDWKSWINDGLGLAKLGFVVAHHKLQFRKGDYRKLLCTPSLATIFLRSFELMRQIKTHYPTHPQQNTLLYQEQSLNP